MKPASDLYEEVALVYTRLVRQESQEAAAALAQIHTTFGSHAALRAGLIITIFNEEIEQYHSIPDIRMYTYLLKDHKEAIPLLEEAIISCLKSNDMPQTDKNGWKKWKQILADRSKVLGNPFEDLIQGVRQHSPFTAVNLEQIYENYGITAGNYAACALIWLEARLDMFGNRVLMELTDERAREFTYFEYMGKNVEALSSFIEMIKCYRAEHLDTSFLVPEVIKPNLLLSGIYYRFRSLG